jgi:hypothetical protein
VFVRFFRSSFATQYIFIGVTGLILWSRAFIQPVVMPLPEGPVPLYRLLYLGLSGYPALSTIAGIVLALACSYLLNWVLSEHDLVVKNTSLASFIFICLVSYFPSFLVLNPVLISLFFLLLILKRLDDSYGRSEPLDLFYATGFLGAIGSFFYQPFVFIFIYLLFALFILRASSWREYLSLLTGILTPFLFLAVYYYWFDLLAVRAGELILSMHFQFRPVVLRSPFCIILSSVIVLFFLAAWLSYISHPPERTIEVRRKSLLIFWIIGLAIVSSAFTGNLLDFHFEFLFIPASWLIATTLLRKKIAPWKEVVFLVLVMIILINNLIIFYL